jgi:hypothetical protein
VDLAMLVGAVFFAGGVFFCAATAAAPLLDFVWSEVCVRGSSFQSCWRHVLGRFSRQVCSCWYCEFCFGVIGLRGVQARECGDIGGVLCAIVVGLVLSGILWIWRCWLALFSVVFFDGRFRRRVCSCWYVEFWFGFIEVIQQVILEMDVYCARFWLSWCLVFGFGSLPFHQYP